MGTTCIMGRICNNGYFIWNFLTYEHTNVLYQAILFLPTATCDGTQQKDIAFVILLKDAKDGAHVDARTGSITSIKRDSIVSQKQREIKLVACSAWSN